MRVCFINMPIEYFSPVSGGAVATVTAEIGAALQRLGHEVAVVSYTDDHSTHPGFDVIDLGRMPSTQLPYRLKSRLKPDRLQPFPHYRTYVKRLEHALRRLDGKPDVLVVHNDPVTPTVLSGLGYRNVYLWAHNELAGLDSRLAAHVRGVVCVSDYIRGYAVRAGVPEGITHTIHNAVDPEEFRPGRHDWDVPRALCIGRIDPNKGFHVALEGLSLVRDRGVPFEVTLAGGEWWYGNGKRSQYTEDLLGKLAELGGNYLGLVPRQQVPAVFRSHDLVFVLSLSEDPFPLVVLEAMASGCAVVASARGGIPEAAGGAATLVETTPVAVAEATTALFTDSSMLRTQQERSLKRALERPWEAAAQEFIYLVG